MKTMPKRFISQCSHNLSGMIFMLAWKAIISVTLTSLVSGADDLTIELSQLDIMIPLYVYRSFMSLKM